jgi:hypothetical protein
VIAVVLLVIDLLDYFRLVPHLIYSYDRSRGAEALEHSLGMARSRNTAALIFALPFCLLVDRYALMRPAFWSGIPAAWSAAAQKKRLDCEDGRISEEEFAAEKAKLLNK